MGRVLLRQQWRYCVAAHAPGSAVGPMANGFRGKSGARRDAFALSGCVAMSLRRGGETHARSIQRAVSTSRAAMARLNHSRRRPWASHWRSSAPRPA